MTRKTASSAPTGTVRVTDWRDLRNRPGCRRIRLSDARSRRERSAGYARVGGKLRPGCANWIAPRRESWSSLQIGKPSVGLEPTTPSLPWKDEGVSSVHRRSPAGTKCLQMAGSLSERPRRPISGRGETGGRNVDGRPVTPHGRISRADLGLSRLIAAGPLGPPDRSDHGESVKRGGDVSARPDPPRVGRRHRLDFRSRAQQQLEIGVLAQRGRVRPHGLTHAGSRLISCSCGAAGASWIGWTRRAAVEAAGGSRCAQPGYGPRGRVGTARLRPWRGDRRHRTRHRPRVRRDRAGWRPCGQRGCRFRCGKSCLGRPRGSRSGAPSPARSS